MQMDTYKGQSNDPLALIVPVVGAIIGIVGEYSADKIEDGKINSDFRHYLAAGIIGSLEASVRAFVPIVNIQPLSFGVDVGSNLLYQAIAGIL